MAVKHEIGVNPGVIDADYTGKIQLVPINQASEPYQVEKEARIAQLVVERISTSE
jgi:dUTPase